ncbi:MAG: hypothetical protein H6887_09480 [Hoeflea sp.]|nr:hypothetical protein [Hoeflea sp.]MCC0035478.1 hypothetical protein [Hoeflea sp.]
MSIVRQLVQIAVVEALRGHTIALENVFDSTMDTVPGLLKGGAQPVLVFSIEESVETVDDATDGFLGRGGVLTGMMQSAVASGKQITDGEGTVIVPVLGETDSAYEALLNIVDRQWRTVLHDHENPWSMVFRDLVVSIGAIRTVRATDPETGTKHACRFAQFEIETMPEPLPGDPIADAVSAGLALMASDGDAAYAALADTWHELLTSGSDLQDWQRLQSALLASNGELLAVGLGPIEEDEDGETPDMTAGTLVVNDGDPIEVTEP